MIFLDRLNDLAKRLHNKIKSSLFAEEELNMCPDRSDIEITLSNVTRKMNKKLNEQGYVTLAEVYGELGLGSPRIQNRVVWGEVSNHEILNFETSNKTRIATVEDRCYSKLEELRQRINSRGDEMLNALQGV